MKNWFKATLAGIVVAAIAVLIHAKKHPANKYDIKGKARIIPDAALALHDSQVHPALMGKIRERLSKFSDNVALQSQGNNCIRFDLDGISGSDTSVVLSSFNSSSKIEFREVFTIGEISNGLQRMSDIAKSVWHVPTPSKSKEVDTTISPEVRELLDNMEESRFEEEAGLHTLVAFIPPREDSYGNLIYSAAIAYIHTVDTAKVGTLLRHADVWKVFPTGLRFIYGPSNTTTKEIDKRGELLALYAINTRNRERADLQNEDIRNAFADFDTYGKPELRLEFDDYGSKKWAHLTEANVGRPLAIIIDNKVVSAPNVNSRIEGGNSVISGGFTFAEVKTLEAQLSTGFIPANIRIESLEISKQGLRLEGKTLFMALIILCITTLAAFIIFKQLKIK